MTKYYVDTLGNYIGGFDGALPPSSSIKVPNPPNHGLDKWINGQWVEHTNPKVFAPLSKWQVRKVLRQFNILETVKAAIQQADEITQEAWECATEYQRDDVVLNAMAQVLGLTDEQLDNMFQIGINL